MDVPFYITKRTDPLRDRSILKRRYSEAPNAAASGFITPQATIARPSDQLVLRGPASPWTAPARGLVPQQPAWSPQQNSATEFNRSDIARQIRANFDSLVRASPLPRAVELLIAPTAGTPAAIRQPWRAQPPKFAEGPSTLLAGCSNVIRLDGAQHAAWRAFPTPSPAQPQSAAAWPEPGAASPALRSSGQVAQLQKPQPVRASPGNPSAGLLQSVLAASPSPSQAQSPLVRSAGLVSGEASAAQASPSTPLGGPAGSAGHAPASRDPRLAARNAASIPCMPHEQACSPMGQAVVNGAQQVVMGTPAAQLWSVTPRDPRLQNSAVQPAAAWQEAEAAPPGASAQTAAAMQAAQQTDAYQPDPEVRQAVLALKGADLAVDDEPGRLPDALLEAEPACHSQEGVAAGTIGPIMVLPTDIGAEGTPEDAMACSGWQVEAFLNDMCSDDEPGQQATAWRGPVESQEACAAQPQREEVQANLEEQSGGAWREDTGEGLAAAVQQVDQLCSDLNPDTCAVSGLADGPREPAIAGPPEADPGASEAARDEDYWGDAQGPLHTEDAAALPLSSSAAGRAPLEERQDLNASQQEGSIPGELQQQTPRKAHVAVHSTSASRRTTQPMGLAGSSLPAVRPIIPAAAAGRAAGSTQERSSASGQCSTLTSHTQRPRQAPPLHVSQEAASSPGKQTPRAARHAHTPSRFRDEVQRGGGESGRASGHAEMDSVTHGDYEEAPLPSGGDAECLAGSTGDKAAAADLQPPAPDAEALQLGDVDPNEGEQLSGLGIVSGGSQRRGLRSAGAEVAQQGPAASTQSDGAQDVQKKSSGKKRKHACDPAADAARKRPAPSEADVSAKQEPKVHAGKADAVANGDLQVSRAGRVRVKPLAFWANQRLSRDAPVINQGFSDQLAQACHSFTQQTKPRPIEPSPAKAPGNKAQASSGAAKPAAQQKTGKTVEGAGKGLKRPAAELLEAAKPRSKRSKAEEDGKIREKPVGNDETMEGALKEPKFIEFLGKASGPVAGKQTRAARFTSCTVCRSKKRGHCGTERAVKGCLKRGQGGKEPPAEPAAAATAPAGMPSPAPELSQGRTLGIKAQLHALSQRQHASPAADKGVGKTKPPQEGKAGSKPSGAKTVTAAQRGASDKQQSSARTATQVAAPAGATADGAGCKSVGAAAQKRQRPGLRRLRKAAETPREDAAELAAAARDLQDYGDDGQEVSAAQLLAQRFSPGGGASRKGKGAAARKKAKAPKSGKQTDDRAPTSEGTRADDPQGHAGAYGAGEANAATPVRGPQDTDEDEEEDADGWTQRQRDALQRAQAEEDPTGNAFWQRVAQQVPGKDAKQCFSKFWAGNPTPAPPRTGPRAYLDAAAAASPLAPPARTTATGNARKLPAAATRKWARQVRWQERASASDAGSEGAADSKAPDAKGRQGLNPRLVAAMQRAQRTDKYIDAIIRKRGNPQRWQSGSIMNGSGRSQVESAPVDVSRCPVLVDSTVAAIASSAQIAPESDDDSERDEYWSGDDSDS